MSPSFGWKLAKVVLDEFSNSSFSKKQITKEILSSLTSREVTRESTRSRNRRQTGGGDVGQGQQASRLALVRRLLENVKNVAYTVSLHQSIPLLDALI